MKKKIFFTQLIVCFFLCTGYFIGCKSENPIVIDKMTKLTNELNSTISIDQLNSYITSSIENAKDLPRNTVEVIAKASVQSKFGEPIDKESSIPIKHVHAVCGGKIKRVGKNKDIGLFIEIQHKDATSIYGNLSDIKVFEDERVSRGEIIGAYDTSAEKDFYYELNTDL